MLELFVDSAVRSATATAKLLSGRRGPARAEPGGSLPGGHRHIKAVRIEAGSESYLNIHDPHRSLWRTVEWRLLEPLCRELPAPIVDLGCGDGVFGALVRGQIDHGIEGDADALEHCDRTAYAKLFHADIREPLPVPDGSVASIFSNSTLEHVVPVEKALASAARALRPGGQLVFTVPTDGLSRAFRSRYGGRFAERLNGIFGHHNLWPSRPWEKRLRAAGFVDVRMRGYLTDEAAIWFASRHLAPWPQLSRRAREWVWKHDLPHLLRLARASMATPAEAETTCVLIEAVKSAS